MGDAMRISCLFVMSLWVVVFIFYAILFYYFCLCKHKKNLFSDSFFCLLIFWNILNLLSSANWLFTIRLPWWNFANELVPSVYDQGHFWGLEILDGLNTQFISMKFALVVLFAINRCTFLVDPLKHDKKWRLYLPFSLSFIIAMSFLSSFNSFSQPVHYEYVAEMKNFALVPLTHNALLPTFGFVSTLYGIIAAYVAKRALKKTLKGLEYCAENRKLLFVFFHLIGSLIITVFLMLSFVLEHTNSTLITPDYVECVVSVIFDIFFLLSPIPLYIFSPPVDRVLRQPETIPDERASYFSSFQQTSVVISEC